VRIPPHSVAILLATLIVAAPAAAEPPDLTADWFVQAEPGYAQAVATAGDVNGDGYSDIVVGSHLRTYTVTGEGMVYVYFGSATGVDSTADWFWAGGATNAGGPAYCAVTERHFWDPFGWWHSYIGNLDAGRCMRGLDLSPEDWGERVRRHAPDGYNGPWPSITIWHGNADDRVKPGNLDELVDQWTYIHGIDRIFDDYVALGPEGRFMHSEYQDAHGIVPVETWQIEGMSHGTAITGEPGERCGRTRDYILDAGICAARRIGRFWGLDD